MISKDLSSDESVFMELVRGAPNLRTLDIRNDHRFPPTSDTLNFPFLTDLEFSIGTSKCIDYLRKWNFPLLENLRLSVNYQKIEADPTLNLQADQVVQVFEHLGTFLKTLRVHFLSRRDQHLSPLTAIFPIGKNPGVLENLQSLSMLGFIGRMDFLAQIPQLRKLDMSLHWCPPETLRTIPFLENLESLDIDGYTGQLFLDRLPGLKKLTVNLDEVDLTRESGESVMALPLQDLGTDLSTPGKLDHLRARWSFPDMKVLHLALQDRRIGNDWPPAEDQITPEELYGFIRSHAANLQELSLDFSDMSDSDFEELENENVVTCKQAFLFPEDLTQLHSISINEFQGQLGPNASFATCEAV